MLSRLTESMRGKGLSSIVLKSIWKKWPIKRMQNLHVNMMAKQDTIHNNQVCIVIDSSLSQDLADYLLISEPIVWGRNCVKMFNWVKVNDGRVGDCEIEAWQCITAAALPPTNALYIVHCNVPPVNVWNIYIVGSNVECLGQWLKAAEMWRQRRV